MKRKERQEEIKSPISKVRRLNPELTLLNIPIDILNLILLHLSLVDIINLSCLDHEYRSYFSCRIFTQIKATWSKLIEASNSKDSFVRNHKSIICQLRIIDCYSYGEWQVDFFTDLLIHLPNLKRLLINSRNSSNWLKYRCSDNIEQLCLYFEKDHFETQNEFLSNNPKEINQIIRKESNTSPRIFSIDHIANFKMLTKITLTDYHFNWEIENVKPVLMIQDISLYNCTWEYPFKLSQFNYNNNIIKLELNYSNYNPFILSERFNNFLNDVDHEDFKSLEELSINITFDLNHPIQTWSKFLSNKLILRFYNDKNFPNLRQLELQGWYLSLQNFKEIIKHIASYEDSHLHLLDLQVFDSACDQSLLEEIEQEWKQLCKWKKLNLNVL